MRNPSLLAVMTALALLPGVSAQVRPAAKAARQIIQAQRQADAQLQRLLRMTPFQRERVLSQMAPERRRRIEARLAEVERMNADERARLGRRLQSFRDLPVDQRQAIRGFAQQLNQMDQPRRRVVRQELQLLRSLPDAERQARLDSEDFQTRFSPGERELLTQLSAFDLPEE